MKKTTKLLSLLLATLMLFGTLPMIASAATISTVEINNVVLPEPGKTAQFTYKCPTGAAYEVFNDDFQGLGMFWAETDKSNPTYEEVMGAHSYTERGNLTFKKGKHYSVWFQVYLKDSNNDSFKTTNCNVTVNGEKAAYKYMSSNYMIVYKTYSCTEKVQAVSINDVVEPVAGEKAKFDFSYTEEEYCTIDNPKWYVNSTMPASYYYLSNEHTADDEALVFEKGKYYTFAVEADCKEGCEFISDMNVTINGNNAKKRYSTAKNSNVFYYTFHIHNFVNSKCAVCGAECTHTYENGTCTACGYVCSHNYENGSCTACGEACPHEMEGNTCKKCGLFCDCGCHKTGIAKFFWSIGNFFRKLFKKDAPCACGAVH